MLLFDPHTASANDQNSARFTFNERQERLMLMTVQDKIDSSVAGLIDYLGSIEREAKVVLIDPCVFLGDDGNHVMVEHQNTEVRTVL